MYFNAADFNAACREITGDSLRYVRFTPPASRYGKLYDQYGGSEAAVTSSTSYYRSGSSRRLDDVSFLAASSYTGIVSIDYTGRSSEGETFSGVVEIQVDSAGGSTTIDIHLPFRDISSSAYYFDAVKWAVSAGITSGTTATTFSPDAIVTRGQTVMFLYRNAGSPASGTGSAFTDVKIGDYYSPAVRWAVANGITSGTSATTFSPSAPCTRAQIVTFLYRTFAR